MPRPNPAWFPQNLQDQAAWMDNFNDQAQATGTTYGLTTPECDQIKDDRNMVVFLADVAVTLNSYNDYVRGFRNGVLEDPIDGTTPTFPANISFSPPTAVPRGIWQRVIEFANRIKASAAYQPEVGEAYQIVGGAPDPIAPGDVKPDIALSAAVHGYLFSIVVSKRYEADDWQVFVRPQNIVEWQLQGSFTGKSADITFNPGGEVPGAVQLEVYVQLRRNNANYGQPSDPAFVTVSP